MNEWQTTKVAEIICMIKDDDLRFVAETEVEDLPEYFWHVPASSSGKYHPSYALGEGGLFRHTLAACKIAIDLFRAYPFTEIEQDRILLALLLHDGRKQGEEDKGAEHTVFEHPVLMEQYLLEKYVYVGRKNEFTNNMCMVADSIASHMGRWTTSDYSEIILPIPYGDEARFVHLCDYLASRKDIEVKLDDDCT